MEKIHVNASKSYDILIENGLLSSGKAAEEIKAVIKSDKVFIVSDDKVAALYLDMLSQKLEAAGIKTASFVFPNGEHSKCANTYIRLLNELAKEKINRKDTVIALGGGVVGDLAGFAAATFLRGISFVQIPTTLLACVDSSVGGKTAIDLDEGKNLAGAFYQPSLVLCDPDLLKTLDETNYKSGMAEVIKYAILGDCTFYDKLLKKSISNEEIIARCVEMKRDIVQQDEFDFGTRGLLNFGHTFGHAIEACSNFEVPHGIAVAQGMGIMARIAYKNGLCDKDTVLKTEEILKVYGLSYTTDYSLSDMEEKILSDKKVAAQNITLIVPRKIGKCELYPLPLNELSAFFSKGFEQNA